MFACLKVTKSPPGGMFSWFSGFFARPKTELHLAQAFGAEFLLVDAQPNRWGEPDWERIAALIRPHTSCLLTPEGYRPPSDTGFAPPRFPDFEQELLAVAAVSLIDATRMPVYRRMLGLYDPEGMFCRKLTALLRHFASVRVVTGQLDPYRAEAARAMEELGAPVIMGDEPSYFADCVLLICPGGVEEPLPLLPACPVLAGGVFADARGCNVFSSPTPFFPADAGVPEGIGVRDFAGALFEHCGAGLSRFGTSGLLINGRKSGIKEAADILLREAGYPTWK